MLRHRGCLFHYLVDLCVGASANVDAISAAVKLAHDALELSVCCQFHCLRRVQTCQALTSTPFTDVIDGPSYHHIAHVGDSRES